MYLTEGSRSIISRNIMFLDGNTDFGSFWIQNNATFFDRIPPNTGESTLNQGLARDRNIASYGPRRRIYWKKHRIYQGTGRTRSVNSQRPLFGSEVLDWCMSDCTGGSDYEYRYRLRHRLRVLERSADRRAPAN